jgi:hypothetical protein
VLLSRSYAAAESHSVNESGESCHDEPLHRKALVKSTARSRNIIIIRYSFHD